MHLIAAIPGGWSPNSEGVWHIEQTPGDIVFLSAGDTELLAFNEAYYTLSKTHHNLPTLRLANLGYLRQELTVDTYIEEVIEHARLVVVRLLGGRSYFRYFTDRLLEVAAERNIAVLLLPGHDVLDKELLDLSLAENACVQQVWSYCLAGGKANAQQALQFVFNSYFDFTFPVSPPSTIPDLFFYHPEAGMLSNDHQRLREAKVVLVAYRTHYLSDNLHALHATLSGLEHSAGRGVILFVHSLREDWQIAAFSKNMLLLKRHKLGVIVNTTSFSIRQTDEDTGSFIFSKLDIPVIQAIHAGSTYDAWQEGSFGLSPSDIAMNVALPELDGRIITRPVSFKAETNAHNVTDATLTRYAPHQQGIDFVSQFVSNWLQLQETPNADKKIALILPNYPNKDSRLANGVGLDTPQSTLEILKALKAKGYIVGNAIPESSRLLMELLTEGVTNDQDFLLSRVKRISISVEDFTRYYERLSASLKQKIAAQWGTLEEDPYFNGEEIVLSGVVLGHVFVGIQPSRGYHIDVQATYHSPDLPPPYYYLAFYFWCEHIFNAHAIVHIGKHGNHEWLPGKSLALDREACFPAATLGAIPHFYPFIINDPGEGTQAKRRTQAIIIDHLIPPMMRAETYGYMVELEHLIDEYYEAFQVDPKRTKLLEAKIQKLVDENNLRADLGIQADDVNTLLLRLDGYLCEIKEAQIRDGLHILGQAPEQEQLVNLLIALHRMPSSGQKGITQTLANDLQLAFDPLEVDYAQEIGITIQQIYCRTYGDVVEQLEVLAHRFVYQMLTRKQSDPDKPDSRAYPETAALLHFIKSHTLQAIFATRNETDHLLKGLNGQYVPPGGSGAPTRGRLDVLPTGKNFYSVDVRTIPTETAYGVGQRSAAALIDLYLQEHGEYPESVGLSVWGTATMRTGGDDLAQAMALMGVRPVWQPINRRMSGFEVVPLFQLGRPRIDVTLRISGFFRDAFPDVISLFNAIVERLAGLEESEADNFIKKRVQAESAQYQQEGVSAEKARQRAMYRVFGSKPGAYGAGLQALIDEQAWGNRSDLAKAYMEWSSYAYDKTGKSVTAPELFYQRMKSLQVVMQNQDNREHDIMDSDDYYQFQGGMASAAELAGGTQPAVYFGDHARPDHPRVKTLKEELLKVFRSRVVNPKWVEGVKRHGYKGAFEMAASLDYMFAYDATTGLVDDFMYEEIAQAYLFDPDTFQFIEQSNPWAIKDMSERLLEAVQRKMWKNPDEATLQQLQDIYLNSEM